jgi:hypothetical protein
MGDGEGVARTVGQLQPGPARDFLDHTSITLSGKLSRHGLGSYPPRQPLRKVLPHSFCGQTLGRNRANLLPYKVQTTQLEAPQDLFYPDKLGI